MKRSQLHPLPEYFDRYINQCDDVSIAEAISTSLHELDNLPIGQWKALGNKVYAPGKWTVKDILQHLADTERVFSYRALVFARQETQRVPNFPEDDYAAAASANDRSIESIVEELKALRRSFKALYDSFTPTMLNNMGLGFKGLYSVASIGYIVPGHQRWHMRVLEEKYYPLLKEYV